MKMFVVASSADPVDVVLADADSESEAFGLQTFLQRHDRGVVFVRESRPGDYFELDTIDLRESSLHEIK